MALADIILNDGQGTPVAHTFTYVATTNGRVVRSDMSASPETPLTMTHAHQNVKRDGASYKSHLLRFDVTKLDADNVTAFANNIRLAADVADKVLSDALADDLAAYIRNWASSANVRAWLKGSVG